MAKLCDRIISAIDKEEIKVEEQREQFKVIEFKSVKKTSNKSKKQKEKLEDMKNITKRDDGRYMIRKVIDGQRITLYANTQAEAREKLQNIKKRSVHIKRTNGKPKLKEYSEQWYTLYKEPVIKQQSKNEIKSVLNKINQGLGEIKINKLTSQDIQAYLNSLPKNRTKERICIYLNAILTKALDTNLIHSNPFKTITKDRRGKYQRHALKYAEQVKLIEEIKKTDIEHEIMIYLMCGCRPEELPSKECFDFENNLINIYGTKNENAEHRTIKMSQCFANYIKDYLETNEIKPRKIVFAKYKQICQKIGLKEITLYTLRHTFATNHFTLGTEAKRVQMWLGHSSIKLTLDIYTDIDETSSKDKIIKLYNNFYYMP